MPCTTRKEEVSAIVAPGWSSAHGGAWGSTRWLGTARQRRSECSNSIADATYTGLPGLDGLSAVPNIDEDRRGRGEEDVSLGAGSVFTIFCLRTSSWLGSPVVVGDLEHNHFGEFSLCQLEENFRTKRRIGIMLDEQSPIFNSSLLGKVESALIEAFPPVGGTQGCRG